MLITVHRTSDALGPETYRGDNLDAHEDMRGNISVIEIMPPNQDNRVLGEHADGRWDSYVIDYQDKPTTAPTTGVATTSNGNSNADTGNVYYFHRTA